MKSFLVPKSAANNEALGALSAPLLGALSEQMETLGYDGDTANIRILSVDGLRATTPKFSDSPSRLMTKLYFTLTVQGRKYETLSSRYQEEDVSIFSTPVATVLPTVVPENTEVLGPFTTLPQPMYVELPIFPTVEALCGLDINTGVDNELFTVVEQEKQYVIQSRRYGHGVGMSQRGAQCMAQNYGWTHEQILRFYYPGMQLGTVKYTHSAPSPLPFDFMATPGPAASPTPRPTLMPASDQLEDGEYKVIVNQISENSYLNLRQEPNTVSPVVRQLYFGQELIVTLDQGEWLKVKTDAAQGYVMAQFVEKIERNIE